MGLIDKLLTGGVVGGIADIVTKLIPDKNARAVARENLDLQRLEAELRIMMTEADLEKSLRESLRDENLGQMKINEVDAGSSNWIQTNWRPMCGWVGAFSLFYTTFGFSAMQWATYWSGDASIVPEPPDTQFMQIVLLGMLGLRGTEKYFQSRTPGAIQGGADNG